MRCRGGEQVFGVHRLRALHRPAHCERQCKTESEAIQMLRRHAADNGFAIAPERQGGGKRLRFRLHLGGGFDDDLRVAAGTRCFQMRFGIGGNGPVFRLPAVFRLPLRLREAFGQMPCLLVNQIVG